MMQRPRPSLAGDCVGGNSGVIGWRAVSVFQTFHFPQTCEIRRRQCHDPVFPRRIGRGRLDCVMDGDRVKHFLAKPRRAWCQIPIHFDAALDGVDLLRGHRPVELALRNGSAHERDLELAYLPKPKINRGVAQSWMPVVCM